MAVILSFPMFKNIFFFLFVITFFFSCSEFERKTEKELAQEKFGDIPLVEYKPSPNPDKNAYFGDLHVHTENSFDAYAFGTTASPTDAYKYAKGEAIKHPTGYQVQLSRPLDFYAVTDHGVFLGVVKEAADPDSEIGQYELTKPLHNFNENVSNSIFSIIRRANLFRPFAQELANNVQDGTVDIKLLEKVSSDVWLKTIEAADQAYVPGSFTTFAAYEYSSSVEIYDTYLHRNVIFRDTKNLPKRIFTRADSLNPEDLWKWMDGLRRKGVESLAIPHNSNISGGAAFKMTYYDGKPIDEAYASQRIRNEPLVEVTQAKGSSETHPLLSKNDEWAAFEIPVEKQAKVLENAKGSYVRNAYLRGLTLAEQGLTNPYKFGLAGASDTHVAGGSYSEETFFSKIGLLDGTPELRGSVPFNWAFAKAAKIFRPESFAEINGKDYMAVTDRLIGFSASGLTGVWAKENTREKIYEAFRRKETFATSGPRIKVRFFSGYDFEDAKINDLDLVKKAYEGNLSMGSTISIEEAKEPKFLVWASADSLGAPLQRIQIIKGWLENGEHQEKVYDVVCSDGLIVNSSTNRCPDNGAKVDIENCSVIENSGASELKTFWSDPDFLMDHKAFYYVRVLENPVCRWSTWDSIREGFEPRSDIPATIQERAWTSPIWFEPAKS
ncbi:MAG: hypothetical protein CM15mP123_11680 [Gammaproteobacteria bacterium]|nr:MAG: hypothetical protein CM15mP123_11680 [Gammaproteobacteria bacterium]